MSNLFEDRERGYEAKWAHDEELHFKIKSLRNARLARWAANMMKLPPEQVDRYVKSVLAAGVSERSGDTIFSRIREDFDTNSVFCPDSTIRWKMRQLYSQAEQELAR